MTADPATRLIVLGSAALTDGFRLIGAETVPDATPEDLESLLATLHRQGERALVILEQDLARSGGPWLARTRSGGSRIALVEIPPLTAPGDYAPGVEVLVRAILGASALEVKP